MRQLGAGLRGSHRAVILNKFAQVCGLVIANDFPERWPSAFSELLRALSGGRGSVDIFLRVLLALDVDVVDQAQHRSPIDAAVAMRVVRGVRGGTAHTSQKDGMRSTCMPEVVSALRQIIQVGRP